MKAQERKRLSLLRFTLRGSKMVPAGIGMSIWLMMSHLTMLLTTCSTLLWSIQITPHYWQLQKKEKNCTCLQHFLQILSEKVTESISAVTSTGTITQYIVWFLKIKPDIQRALVMEWIRYSLCNPDSHCFVLSVFPHEDGDLSIVLLQEAVLCHLAMQKIASKGYEYGLTWVNTVQHSDVRCQVLGWDIAPPHNVPPRVLDSLQFNRFWVQGTVYR